MVYHYQNLIELYDVDSCFCPRSIINETPTSLQNKTLIFISVELLSSFKKTQPKIKSCTFFIYTKRSKSHCKFNCTGHNTLHTRLVFHELHVFSIVVLHYHTLLVSLGLTLLRNYRGSNNCTIILQRPVQPSHSRV
jgi:hypothetical protein